MGSRRRLPAALLLVLAVITLSALFASTAAALQTFTQAVGGVGPCNTCHTQTATHAVAAHAAFFGSCGTCHGVDNATPPSSCAANNCHGGATAILTAHAAQPAPGAGCATTAGCHGVPAGAEITAIAPAQAEAGANVTITGTGFGATQSTGTVMFGAVAATVVSWSDTSIVVTVPASLAAGAVQVVVTPAGGTATAGFSFTVQAPGVDTVAPTTTFTGVVNGKWYNRSKTITFTATDNTGGSGVASITYAVNGATPVVVSAATAQVMIDVDRATHADDGTYAVTYFATDVAGNAGTSKTVTVKIDTRKPGTMVFGKVTVVRNQTVRVAYKITDQSPSSGKAAVTIKIKTRRGKTVKTVRVGVKAVNKTLQVAIKANLKPGAYRYFVYAKDTAGNTQANVANKAFRVRAASISGFNG